MQWRFAVLCALAIGCGFTDKERKPPPEGIFVDGSIDPGTSDAGAEGGGGGWICDEEWQNEGSVQYCDCGCGAPDPDCAGGGCSEVGCCNLATCAGIGCVFCGPDQETCL
jgi:hypothetical protein